MGIEQEVSLSVAITGHGWADLSLRVRDQEFTLDGISDTTDAIGDLLRATLEIATGGLKGFVSFDREPLEWRLLLTHVWEGVPQRRVFRVKVLEFADIYAETPAEMGDEAFTAECEPEAFVLAVAKAASDLLATVCNSGKSDVSGFPFPIRAYAALRAALAEPPEWTIA